MRPPFQTTCEQISASVVLSCRALLPREGRILGLSVVNLNPARAAAAMKVSSSFSMAKAGDYLFRTEWLVERSDGASDYL